jgi:3-ketosteroid 9alpha-monooxygenase subunit A
MYGGWYLAAFEGDLKVPLTPVHIGDAPLMLVCDGQTVRAFDAVCPHRGANLAIGGRLDRDAVICPFHGRRITLREQPVGGYCVREYPVLGYGGMFFVRCSDAHENGLETLLEKLVEDHVFFPCFAMEVRARADLVTENAFDESHFRPVHGVRTDPFQTYQTPGGALVAETSFEMPVNAWQMGDGRGSLVRVPFTAHAFSPHLVATHLGGAHPYWAITGATPVPGGSCVVRFSVALPSGRDPMHPRPSPERVRYLAQQSRGGIEQDQVVWENLQPPAQPRYGPEDVAVVAFRDYCRQFGIPALGRADATPLR